MYKYKVTESYWVDVKSKEFLLHKEKFLAKFERYKKYGVLGSREFNDQSTNKKTKGSS